ncbi:MAG: YitT family protein [Ginsengibacter sp.]
MQQTGKYRRNFRGLKDVMLIATGVVSAGFGINGFLLSSHFIDGGVTGISMLLTDIFGYPISVLLALLNVPFIILGYRRIGLKFAVKTSLSILGLALCLAFLPYPDVTPDKLLTAVFGGFFIGAGIGLAMRGGAVLDGTEIAAVLLSKSSAILKVSDVILLLNVLIFTAAAFFLGVEPALYSILTYFAASKMIDYVVNGIEEYTAVTIISDYSEEVKELIINKLHHGVTLYKGTSGYGKRGEKRLDNDILYTVITRLEAGNLQIEINKIDPEAVIIHQSINSIKGGIIKKRALH